MISEILSSGVAQVGPTTWRGTRCMRISVCGWRARREDVDRVVDTVRRILTTLG